MRRDRFGRGGWLGALGLTVIALLTTASVAIAQPAGNNGTVKIHDGATDAEPIVRNEPHVATFHLHFLFADPTQSGWWQIRAWEPGDKGAVVLSGTYDTAGDGADRRPAQGAYTLASGHYKLFWEGRTEKNIKHKAFWVQYVAPTATPTATARPTPTAQPTGTEEPASGQPTGSVEAITGAPTLPATDAGRASEPGPANFLPTFALLGWIAILSAVLTPDRSKHRRR